MDENRNYPDYQIISEGGTGEIIEKKSRFIATCAPVQTQEEAAAFIEATRKKYWDARHNCSAFVLGARSELTRCSDDGEPAQTAGKPILEVLLGRELTNAAVVVTRYFGGTLLGTGGLVRAYTQATQAGLDQTRIAYMQYGSTIRIKTDYTDYGKVQYLLAAKEAQILETRFTEQVEADVRVPFHEVGSLQKEVTQATAGRAHMEITGSGYYMVKIR